MAFTGWLHRLELFGEVQLRSGSRLGNQAASPMRGVQGINPSFPNSSRSAGS